MNAKRLIITSLFSITLVCLLLIGTTYSIFTTGSVEENANVYKTGSLDITYTIDDNNIKLESNIPTSKEEAIYIKPYRLTVTNKGNIAYKFNIILNNTTATTSINPKYIMTQVGTEDATRLSEHADNVLKENIIIKAGEEVNIDTRIFLSSDIPNSEIGKNFTASLSLDGVAASNDEDNNSKNSSLTANYIAKHSIIDLKDAVSDKDRDYTKNTPSDKTLYYTADAKEYGENSKKIYYYAGNYNQVNNWVIFAKNSSNVPMCFRIIRTTETGGTKLIYAGIAKNNTCENNQITSNNLTIKTSKYANSDNIVNTLWQGQNPNNLEGNLIDFKNVTTKELQNSLKTYKDIKNYDSIVKNEVRTWYYNNIVNTGYKNYLEEMNLCIEMDDDIANQNTNANIYFNNSLRNNNHPSYKCSQDNQIKSKYGLITASEAIYTGLTLNDDVNTSNWLQSDNYWTISPSYITADNKAYLNYIDKTSKLKSALPTTNLGIRPVITLKHQVTKKSGDGSINNPYIIEK